MDATPNLEKLKDAACSDDLVKSFNFFKQQMRELECYIQKLGEDCSNLRKQIEKEEEYVYELETFHEDATSIIECINDTLERQRCRLAYLETVLLKARYDMEDKKRQVAYMRQQMNDQD